MAQEKRVDIVADRHHHAQELHGLLHEFERRQVLFLRQHGIQYEGRPISVIRYSVPSKIKIDIECLI